jgi:leader peptidase (prepilin peptidase)/N-methyltransferase
MAALFVVHAWYFSGSLSQALFVDVLCFYLLTITLIDYRHRIIPDELSLSLLILGLLFSFVNPYLMGSPWIKFAQSFGASLGGGLFMFLLAYAGEKAFKKEALGGGDIKLIAASAAALGWGGIVGPLLLGSFSGGLMAFVLLLLKKKKMGETLAFGPFLSLGIYLTCLFPHWWTAFFGLPQ